MTTTSNENNTSFNRLKARLTGLLLLPEDAGYQQACQLWNGNVQTQPAAIVRCVNVQDVIETVRWARSHDLPLSVRGGGHDFAGRALRDHGIVIDCSQMRAVTIDSETRTARIEGGATASDLIQSAQHYGLVTTTGACSSVGMVGMTLGGGYGPLVGAYGLAIDNLLSAQVVTATGELVTANPTEHADLFWGLRGGGGNFGIVVSLEYRLHPHTTVLGGLLLYSLEQARDVLHLYDELIATAPDELAIQPGFMQTPDGQTVLFLAPTYCGSQEKREQVLALLRGLGQPMVDQVQSVEYSTLLHALDPLTPQGRNYYIQTQSLQRLTTKAVEVLIEQALPLPSPFSMISIHDFHGAASRVGGSETAFALRQDHFMFELIAAWEGQSPEEGQRCIHWAQNLSHALAPYAFIEGYINLLDVSEQERVLLAFGQNYERLLAIKRIYDPNDAFSSTIGHIVP